jgi:hypothetical protein
MQASIRERSDRAHRRTVDLEANDIARFLVEVFGRRLVAHMAGVSVKAVEGWIDRDVKPRRSAEDRLRAAFQVYQLLQEEESAHTIRAWFIGMNPQLNDEAPAMVLREGKVRDVLVAARAYIAGG